MKTAASIAKGAWLIVLLLAVWEALSKFRVLDPLFFPPPSVLFGTLRSLTMSGELGHQITRTLERTAVGFGAGVVAGVIVSVVLAVSVTLRQATQPLISALYSMPHLTLLPMLMLLLGVNDVARVLLVVLTTALVMVIQTSDAIRGIKRDYVDMAVNYGAGSFTVIRKVYFPACLPQIFTALRLAFGRALVLTISLELLNCDDGLGSMIWNAWQTFAIEKLYVSIALAGVLGVMFQGLFQLLEKRFVPWTEPAR
jgi:ABC-type nitrate/sulfonate/bicarbonate transport system permease component